MAQPPALPATHVNKWAPGRASADKAGRLWQGCRPFLPSVPALRLFKPKTAEPPQRDQLLEGLRVELESLSEEHRAAVARGLAMLWDAFLGQFGGLDVFLGVDRAQRAAYLRELQDAAERMSKVEALVASRYSLSPTILILYLEALARGDRSATARKFGEGVANLIELGRQLRPRNE